MRQAKALLHLATFLDEMYTFDQEQANDIAEQEQLLSFQEKVKNLPRNE